MCLVSTVRCLKAWGHLQGHTRFSSNQMQYLSLTPHPPPTPPRRIPVALSDKLENGLKRVEDLGVIVKVSAPTYWENSIATPEKQRTGALRVCVDSRDLNRAIMREHYPLPTLEDLKLLLPNAKYFSVLDATSDYWHIKLDDESSLLTSFNTPCVWTVLLHQNALRNTLSPGGIPENNGRYIWRYPSLMICWSGYRTKRGPWQ